MNCVGVRSHVHQVLREKGKDPVALDPWYFPTAEEYQEVSCFIKGLYVYPDLRADDNGCQLLESEGFTVEHISLTPRITPLASGLHGWLQTFVGPSFLAGMESEEAEEMMGEVARRVEVECGDMRGGWAVMYVRLRFVARWSGDGDGKC